ncbi:GntR family transcriptional regulator [Corynebacterium sp. A21]|uniref:GntR family transcriptional regulator n=1 Tax=Corynebacterium sp. A21 TaxID=3457318 RepID=UPI003FD13304
MKMLAESGLPAADQVSADLRGRVLNGELAPGAPLGEAAIAEEYGVSRATAKNALETLVASRLLSRQAHRSARVTVLSSTEVEDIYRTRELIESEAVRRLAQVRLVPEEARRANAEIAELAEDDQLQLIEPDVRFHTALVDALASTRTTAIYRGLSDEIRLCMVQVQGATLLAGGSIPREHAQLLSYIEGGDEPAAVHLLQEHISRSRRLLSARLRDRTAGGMS